MTKHVLAVFRDRFDADRAASNLDRAGYPADQVSVLMGEGYHGRQFAVEAGNKGAEGAATGGALGGALGAVVAGVTATGAVAATGGAGLLAAGPIVAALTGAGAGAVAGGALGGLVGMGIPEHRAKIYHDVVAKNGGLLLGVEAEPREVDNVKAILKDAGGESLSVE